MKIYLAARYSKRPTLQRWAEKLQELGHEIVSRWALRNSDHKLVDGLSPKAATDERIRFAEEDIEDLIQCDMVVSLMEEPRGKGRGGRHVEFGYALALHKDMVIIGPKETVFHELPQIDHFTSFEEFFANLSRYYRR
jgi:nucleoside 2-deoxyribosyltransferase